MKRNSGVATIAPGHVVLSREEVSSASEKMQGVVPPCGYVGLFVTVRQEKKKERKGKERKEKGKKKGKEAVEWLECLEGQQEGQHT